MASMTRCTSNAERPDTAGWRRVCTAATKSSGTARWAVWSNAMGSAPAPLLSLAPQLKCEPFVSYLQMARLNRLLGIKKGCGAHPAVIVCYQKHLAPGLVVRPGQAFRNLCITLARTCRPDRNGKQEVFYTQLLTIVEIAKIAKIHKENNAASRPSLADHGPR